jgi:RNA-binding protein YhbY
MEAAQLQLDCKEADLILKCDFTSSGRDEGESIQMVYLKDRQFFAQHAYVLELMRRQLPVTQWRPLPNTRTGCDCSPCAPHRPNLRWKIIGEGSKQTIKPYEDPSTAAVYERAIKRRPPPILFETVHQSWGSTMHFGINLASLAHRAVAHLPANHKTTCRLSWIFEQDLASSRNFTFEPFVLRLTEGPSSPNADVGMRCRLFPKQALVLHWMQQQELGRSFTLEDAEEAIVPALGWRAEVRAETDIKVRGGICADHPGFGKTITSLALIHSNLSDGTDIAVDLRTRQTTEDGTSGLIATQATLIVAPNTLIEQWASEIKDKLGYNKKELVKVSVLKNLDKYKTADFQKAKVVLVSRAVLGHEGYSERIANFVGMPGPATSSGRAFSQWLSHASKEIPAHLDILENKGLKALQSHVKSRYAELIESEDFKAVVPSRRLAGKDYDESKDKKDKNDKKAKKAKKAKKDEKDENDKVDEEDKYKGAPSSIRVENIDGPLFEHFFWNRIIADEFHIYSPREYAALKSLNADKRWGLSGTPAMNCFYDMAQIAGLLNIPLRIRSDSTRVMSKNNATSLWKDLSDFERFDMMREVPSDCMHARMHEIAQAFLENFARRNLADFDDMAYDDNLVPVTLDVDHQAAYTELSQQLASQEMNIRKFSKGKKTTRDQRFMAAIEGLDTAEEALSRDAAYFSRQGERQGSLQTGLKQIIDTRKSEVENTLAELKAACLAAQHRVSNHNQALEQMAKSLLDDRTLGDEETIGLVKKELLSTARSNTGAILQKGKADNKKKSKASDDSDAEEGEDATPKESKDKVKGRDLTVKVHGLAKSLLTSVRSKRYITIVESIANSSTRPARCDNAQCSGTGKSSDAQIAVSGLCGHLVCKSCHLASKEKHRTLCHAPGCSAAQFDHHLLWSHILGEPSKATPYGAKLDAAVDLLLDIRKKGEKAILFVQYIRKKAKKAKKDEEEIPVVQYSEQLDQAKTALRHAKIAATVVTSSNNAGQQIADFCRDNNKDTVLVLNASDETAAGSNIQAANHVIFLSPLLCDSQYGYDSTMAQAIGRVRRHGQKRPIHVYRICALHTIDVDILEHRELRRDALTEQNAPDIAPPLSSAMDHMNEVHDQAKLQRVQLVNEDGKFSLRPKSWLYEDDIGDESDEQKMERVEGRDRAGWEDFSSQVKFSRAFDRE